MNDGARARNSNGSAYGRLLQHPDEELVRVGAGTPMGELFRRYWLPVAISSALDKRPVKVRICVGPALDVQRGAVRQ